MQHPNNTHKFTLAMALAGSVAVLSACGGMDPPSSGTGGTGGTGGSGTNNLTVSSAGANAINGTYSLSTTSDGSAGGTSTLNVVSLKNGKGAELRIYYNPTTKAYTNIQFSSSDTKSIFCMAGEPLVPCPSAAITFDTTAKKAVFTAAKFITNGLTTKDTEAVLDGTVTW